MLFFITTIGSLNEFKALNFLSKLCYKNYINTNMYTFNFSSWHILRHTHFNVFSTLTKHIFSNFNVGFYRVADFKIV